MPRRLSSIDRAAYTDNNSQVLRIAASDVAAVAGYHEWVDVRELFLERLLYQDLEHVFRMDAANVGVEVEDKRQRAERLLAKAGDRELRKVRTRAGDGAAVATVQDAQALREKARSLLKEAQAKKKISEAEAKEIENDLRYDINTQFGTRNENDAIAVYERRSGMEVICSNERILVWPFPGDREGVGVPDGALNPPQELSEGWTKSEAARDSLKRARSTAQAADHTSAAEDASFAAAAARCLAELPALAALERAKGVLASAPASTNANGTDQEGPQGAADQLRANGFGQCREEETVQGGSQGTGNIGERAGNGEMGIASSKRAGNGEGEAGNCVEEAGNGKDEGVVARGSDVDVVPAGRRDSTSVAVVGRAPEGEGCGVKSGADAESVGPPTLPGSSAPRPGETRQLAPGVPWPEWRESAPLALSGLKEAAGSPVKKLAPEGSGPSPALSDTPAAILTPSVVPAADEAAASAAGEGWAGEPGLWFPGVLAARQRAVVETAAEELGLRHDMVGGESGGLRVVVWESLTAPSSTVPGMPSPSGPLVSPSVAAAPAAETDGTITTKRDPSCPPPPAPAKVGKDGPGGAAAAAAATAAAKLRSGGQGDGARRTSMAPAGFDTGRLDATAGAAATRPRKSARNSFFSRAAVGGSLAPAQAAVTGAMPVVAGENADATASPGGSSPPASKGPAETTVDKGTPGDGGGSGDGNGGSARALVTSVDDFGVDAVYAWGEGPAAACQAIEAEEGPSAGLEPSVWSRTSLEAIDATAATDAAAGLPSSRAAGADNQDEGRVMEESRSGAGCCAEEEGGGARTVTPATVLLNSRGGGKETSAETLMERRKKACFVIAGAVDGVAEEVTDAPENGDAWETRRVVVEVKNRMIKARHPPPLYDQIQLVTYMLMIGASVGDLVQFVKTNAGRRSSRKLTAAKPRGLDQMAQASKEEDVVVSRVELDCRAYHHRKHWQESVLPRLYEFARMVYRFRGDDMLRFRYLLAGPDERRHMLVECCPYLDGAIPRPVVHPPLRLPPPPPPETGLTSPEIIVIDQESSAPTSVQADAAGETTSADVGATPSVGTEPGVVGVVEVTEITGEAVGGPGGGGGHGSVRPDRGGGGGCCEPPPTASGTRRTPSTQSECSGERGAVKVLARSPKRDGRCFQHSGLAVTAEVEAAAAAAVLPLRKKTKREDDVAIGRVPFVKAQNVQ